MASHAGRSQSDAEAGLVDRHNNGAHYDMAHSDFLRSADAIAPWLSRFVEYGAASAALEASDALAGLRALGQACEADMFRATAGVNTHKGSIFSLGLLCAAIGRSHQRGHDLTPERLCDYAAQFCRGLVARELAALSVDQASTAGQRLFVTLGITGARGEAEAGYPLVRQLALPHYRHLLTCGRDPELALLDTLLLLMAHNQDTNVAARGGSPECVGYGNTPPPCSRAGVSARQTIYWRCSVLMKSVSTAI
ncbi:triphosphoribosyl-dephospho-CoA synthase [Edwardsiella tarda]|nr:triphosphoribosyl-dephospho-CoA synthase [Edwardsiella tarda]